MGVMNKTSSIETTIIGMEDNQRTYEIVKELKGDVKAKEDVILIQVFPTISPEDCTTSDVTTFHLVNKMKDLGWKKVHILNIFSCVSKERLKARDLMSVDEENMLYIKEKFAALGKDIKVIIAWGNNLLSNKVANQSKLRILETYRKLYPNGKLYQLTCDALEDETDSTGTHLLFLGLRYSKEQWRITDYPIQQEMARLKEVLGQKEKRDEKKGGENNVSSNNE